MNRVQVRILFDYFSLLWYFVDGGEIGHRMHSHDGQQVAIYPTKTILLSCIESGGITNYCRVKPRYRYNRNLDRWEPAPRYWPETIKENEVINP